MWLAIAGLVALAFVVFGLAQADEPWVTATDQRGVYIATLPCGSEPQTASTGYVVDDRTVVTVAHAIFESRDFAVRDSFGRWHDATIEHLDLADDLAVLRAPGLRALGSELTAERAVSDWPNTPVRMLDGAASGTVDGKIVRRIIIKIDPVGTKPGDLDDTPSQRRAGYEVELAMAHGDSGAALLDDQDRLVGLVFARSTGRFATWATAADEIDLDAASVPDWDCETSTGATEVNKIP